jgi:HK97 family phage portal protein
MGLLTNLEFAWKHRGQPHIQDDEGKVRSSSHRRFFFEKSYDFVEVVRRGVDLIVDSASEIDVNITDSLPGKPVHQGTGRIRQKTLLGKLNFRPNENEDISSYRRELIMDFILTGNVYQYFDGDNLYHLPAKQIEIVTDKKRKVSHYLMNGKTKFYPYEIIHTKDNAGDTVYEGKSRLLSTRENIIILRKMLKFQETFFENGAVPGLVIQTPNILGEKIKQKLLTAWKARYNPESGGKSPMILDGDLKVNPLSQTKFSELDFEESVRSHELKILKALGVPPILLDSGNNANIRPNIQLFYETTVLPIVAKLISSYERFFAYDMEPDVAKVRALRPELRDAAQYYMSLVNTGIITINEARAELRLELSDEEHADELRIPANIAGSAVDPSEGGRPSDEEDEDSNEENPINEDS